MLPAPHAPHDRRAIVALFVMFALMVQALIPTSAMAASGDGHVTICTAEGTQTFAPDGKPDSPAHHHGSACADCLAAALVTATPPPALDIQPVAYTVSRVEHATPTDRIVPRARAPPRPPGQGPPISLQTA
ncbi:MAG TPA: DUF2946 family protein [Caulobacteraceae bacterium]|nr:DUF2946 family protein [Caulobacteraceae bacterium]